MSSNDTNNTSSAQKRTLNTEQQEAAHYTDGHILVLAGAGTGKTTMLLHRFLYLIREHYCAQDQILMTTFTTKAAEEMRKRIAAYNYEPEWIGTFHSLCGRIVRTHAERLGIDKSFQMIDAEAQKYIMHKLFALQADEIDEQIQQWKNKLLTCTDISPTERHYRSYHLYQRTLKDENQLDFSDLIILCCKLWEQHPDILKYYQNQFKYICVDEFQDTNYAQMHWLRLLLGIADIKTSNASIASHALSSVSAQTSNINSINTTNSQPQIHLFCVGDDDQMIYSWRNASTAYILDFQLIFKNAKIVKLRQNYRSTQSILRGALDIVSKNSKRFHKVLLSNREQDMPIILKSFVDDSQESKWIAQDIIQSISQFNPSQANANNTKSTSTNNTKEGLSIGILLRTVWQVNDIRKVLAEYHITDKSMNILLEHLKFIYTLHYSHIIQIFTLTKKGLGEKTLEKFENKCQSLYSESESLSESSSNNDIQTERAEQISSLFSKQTINSEDEQKTHQAKQLEILKTILLESSRTKTQEVSIQAFFILIEEWLALKNNIRELMMLLCKQLEIPTVIGNLLFRSISQASSVELFIKNYRIPQIHLMTVHASKGLEFDIVYLPGWEEKIFPHVKAVLGDTVDEERRLAYVAITRARFRVTISYAMLRQSPRGLMKQIPSRFISDLSSDIICNL